MDKVKIYKMKENIEFYNLLDADSLFFFCPRFSGQRHGIKTVLSKSSSTSGSGLERY